MADLTEEEENDLWDAINEVSDLTEQCTLAADDIENAGTVETMKDFRTSLVSAKKHLAELVTEIDRVLASTNKKKKK